MRGETLTSLQSVFLWRSLHSLAHMRCCTGSSPLTLRCKRCAPGLFGPALQRVPRGSAHIGLTAWRWWRRLPEPRGSQLARTHREGVAEAAAGRVLPPVPGILVVVAGRWLLGQPDAALGASQPHGPRRVERRLRGEAIPLERRAVCGVVATMRAH